MNENFKYLLGAVAVVSVAVGAFFYLSPAKHPVKPPVAASSAAPMPADDDSVPKHPLPPNESQQALPSLDESDNTVGGALSALLGKDAFDRTLIQKDLVRHLVVSIDNLPEQKVAERVRPNQRVPGRFTAEGPEDAPVLDPRNYERYKPMVQMLRSVDAQQLVASYTRYYPLFQEAYESLGHPPQYFNDRLVQVIDHLLATPDVHDPIELARPNVLYEFADPKLEALSAGQKALIRMGSENAKVVKDKLKELRAALLAQSGHAPG